MTRQVDFVVSTVTPEEGYPDYANNNVVWFKPILTGEVVTDVEVYQRLTDGSWKKLFSKGGDMPDINFTGTVSVDGEEGLSGTKVTPIGTLTFTKGLLTGFTPP